MFRLRAFGAESKRHNAPSDVVPWENRTVSGSAFVVFVPFVIYLFLCLCPV
jgi:hypothetical protein